MLELCLNGLKIHFKHMIYFNKYTYVTNAHWRQIALLKRLHDLRLQKATIRLQLIELKP